ncbi:JAB domain-containing protein [Azoarcus olearius]|uniref:DNA repair protein n=1 Tax=Azoarcus sp. (strain BH72) TaxID=418699 RepID=A1K759_AZOSB|nr:DNA repair protein RadC [Azoarcus olearius]CAL94664.1 DNA repair protein [Azoarcus olearius]
MSSFYSSPTALADAALLERFFGPEAEDVWEGCDGSWSKVVELAREPRTPAWDALACAIEILHRSFAEQLSARNVLDSPGVVRQFLRTFFEGKPYEIFVVLYLDAQNRLIRAEEAFRGTLTQTSVYPREILRRSLELHAAGVIFSHQHPSGVCEPSSADEVLTNMLKSALTLVDVRVLDHIVVAGDRAVSFAETGRL